MNIIKKGFLVELLYDLKDLPDDYFGTNLPPDKLPPKNTQGKVLAVRMDDKMAMVDFREYGTPITLSTNLLKIIE